MPETLRDKIRQWYILGIAICLILGGAFLASLDSHQSNALTVASAAPTPSAFTKFDRKVAEPNATVAVSDATRSGATSAPTSPDAHDMNMLAQRTPSPQTIGQAAPAPGPAVADVKGDSAAGRLVFRKCQACHSMELGKNVLGPSLSGIVGRKAGSEPSYNYSPAMKQANIVWSVAALDAYLADPEKAVPGNKMPFPGLKTNQDRTDVIAFLASSGSGTQQSAAATPPMPSAAGPPAASPTGADIGFIPDAKYTLRSGIADGRMVYIGVGGAIEGKTNPVLTAAEGQVVQLTVINGEGAEHDIVFPSPDAKSPRVTGKNTSTTIAFRAIQSGDFIYFCSVPGHQLAGMQGQFIVTPKLPAQSLVEADISREPSDLPAPIGKRDPKTVRIDLLALEVEGRLAEGTTFGYWTFNGKVPGPFLRVRVGDTIDIHLKNSADSSMIHSVDFHATTGPGGGAAALQVNPGDEKSMT